VRAVDQQKGKNDADKDQDEVDARGFRQKRREMIPLQLVFVQERHKTQFLIRLGEIQI